MDKINEIFKNKEYRNLLEELNKLEKDRKFCKHDIEHFLNVSRIAYIKVLEKNLNISKDVVYAIGLLHDIGRVLEYKKNIPHHEGSLIISDKILNETSYTKEEKDLIKECIKGHRQENCDNELLDIINKSDKLSRECFKCKMEKECYWKNEKKNFIIKY